MPDFNLKFTRDYGIYSKIIRYKDELYIVASPYPISDDIAPDEVVRRRERNIQLFYPDIFAVRVRRGDNMLSEIGKLVNYCREAELVTALYAEFNLPVPHRMKYSEVYSLSRSNFGRNNSDYPPQLRALYSESLVKYFKYEKHGGLRGKWREFYRSNRYDDNSGRLKNLRLFLRRHSPETEIDLLVKSGESVKWIAMQEHEYTEFRKIIKEYYPEICIAVGDKYVVDHGMVDLPGRGRSVTFKEFCEIRNKRFATEGYRAIENLNVSQWEFRDVYFKTADEADIAQIYNNISLDFVKCVPLQTLLDMGEVECISIPANELLHFVAYAQENNLPYCIDKWGDYKEPELDNVCIVYNKHNSGLVRNINRAVMGMKMQMSHAISSAQRELLNSRIEKAANRLQVPSNKEYKSIERAM